MKTGKTKRANSRFLAMKIAALLVYALLLAHNIAFFSQPARPPQAVLLQAVLTVLAAALAAVLYDLAGRLRKLNDAMALLEQESDGLLSGGEAASGRDYLIDEIPDVLNRYRTAMHKKYSEQTLLKQIELKALQSQINPHFLYNTLDAIRGKALMRGDRDISKMTEALAILFRYSIARFGDLVPLEEELRTLQYYLTIQKFRFRDKFEVIEHIENPERCLHTKIPKLTIQPIVENAIYHGLETQRGQGVITISVYPVQSRLMVTISDNGVGIDEETLARLNAQMSSSVPPPGEDPHARGVGMALVNVNERIKLSYGEGYGVTIYSTLGAGTDVELSIPLLQTAHGEETPHV
nr:sensor histidine kinase [Maliibacterium massiliense]